MLDRLHAVLHEPGDGFGGVGVSENISAPVARRLDCGLDLGRGGLQRVDWIVIRHHAAATHDLDLRGAVLEVFAHRAQVGVDAVGQDPAVADLVRVRVGDQRIRLMRHARVAMSGRLRYHRTRGKDPGPIKLSRVKSAGQVRMRSAGVANTREPVIQVVLRHCDRACTSGG